MKTALITGGAKRLGKMISLSLAEEGYNIILHYNSSDKEAIKTKEEIEKLKVSCFLIRKDLKNYSSGLIEEAMVFSKNIDILINNASIFIEEKIFDVTEENYFETIKINSYVPLKLSLEFKEKINKGLIINIIDARVHQYDFTHFSYGLSKKLLYEITKHLAVSFAPDIRVNGIAPGVILPPEGKDEKYLENILKLVPLKRKGEREEMKKALKFLIENEYLTGQIIYLDGGRHLGKNLY